MTVCHVLKLRKLLKLSSCYEVIGLLACKILEDALSLGIQVQIAVVLGTTR
jgi:hypothetical protein